MRGFNTFSQLVWGNPSLVAVGVFVWDSLLFAHKRVMLDTSKNYYPVEDILRTIAAMSMNKHKVFHWHITDSHSFPLVVPSEPSLAEKGSYGSNMQYSPADVSRIVEYGLDHGVRVLPKIDALGMFGMLGGTPLGWGRRRKCSFNSPTTSMREYWGESCAETNFF